MDFYSLLPCSLKLFFSFFPYFSSTNWCRATPVRFSEDAFRDVSQFNPIVVVVHVGRL